MDIFWIENLLIDHCEAESSKCSAEKPTWQSSPWGWTGRCCTIEGTHWDVDELATGGAILAGGEVAGNSCLFSFIFVREIACFVTTGESSNQALESVMFV